MNKTGGAEMVCEKCKIEFGGDACPQCEGKESKQLRKDVDCIECVDRSVCEGGGELQKMIASPDGIVENYNVVRMKRERCRKCLKQLACSIVGKAKKAKPGTIIGGLFVAKLYDGNVWQRVLDCREFIYMQGKNHDAR